MTEGPTLYRRLLGARYDLLPLPIAAMHDLRGTKRASGRAMIRRGRHLVSRLIGAILRLPPAGDDVPVTVVFTVDRGRETWARDFGGRGFTTTQEAGTRAAIGCLVERFGAFAFTLAVPVDDQGLRLDPTGVSFFGVPLPGGLLPRVVATERVCDGRFTFDVTIDLPLFGFLIAYRGWLVETPDMSAEGARESRA